MKSIHIHPITASLLLVGGALLTVARGQQVQQFMRLTPEQSEILSHMSIVYLDDGQGGQAKTIRFTGVNVQVVNGLGATNGNPKIPDATNFTEVNGVGNLIVGYNEFGSPLGDDRTGSHNLVVGRMNSYSGLGGAVIGDQNRIDDVFTCVLAGLRNRASEDYACVAGGTENSAPRFAATVSGGAHNTASGPWSSVTGGDSNVADGHSSTVSGGRSRVVSNQNPGTSLQTDWIGGSIWQDE